MKRCLRCDSRHGDAVRFCSKCGGELIPDRTTAPEFIAKRQRCEELLQRHPDNPDLAIKYGNLMLEVGLATEALIALHKALESVPDHTGIRHLIARCHMAKQHWREACRFIEPLLGETDVEVSALQDLTHIYKHLDRWKDLVELLSKMRSRSPLDEAAQMLLLEALSRTEQWQELEGECNVQLWDRPARADLWTTLADCRIRQGRIRDATDAFRELLRFEPENARAKLYIGISEYDSGTENQASAGAPLDYLEAVDPDSPLLTHEERQLLPLYTAAARLRIGGSNEEIEDTLKRVDRSALRKGGRQLLSSSLETLADLQAKSGHRSSARANLRLALETEDSDQVRRKLDSLNAEIKGRNAKVRTFTGATVLVAILLAAGIYYARGAFVIAVSPPATITLYDGDQVVEQLSPPENHSRNSTALVTPMLWYGTYHLEVARPGFERVSRDLHTGYGRRTLREEIQLAQAFGSVRVSTDPPGAAVTIESEFGRVSGQTPCELKKVAAAPSTLTLNLNGYTPYSTELNPGQGEIVDLGTVRFIGTLTLDSSPSGAAVQIDGSPAGDTPLSIELTAKRHRVELWKPGAGRFARTVEIEPAGSLDLGVVALSTLGEIRLATTPEGAEVRLNGRTVGLTPVHLTKLRPGSYSLRIAPSGRTPLERSISLQPGESIDMGMISFEGGISVRSDPPAAEIFLDGLRQGETPATIRNLPSRKSFLVLRKGDSALSREIHIPIGEVLDLGTLQLSRFGSTVVNLARGRPCSLETNGVHEKTENLDPARLTNGVVEKQGHSVGWNNRNDGELMKVTVTCDLGETSKVTQIRYNMGNIMRPDRWNADRMVSPLGDSSTNPGRRNTGAWTAHEGELVTNSVAVTFEKTKRSWDTDWLFISELEINGIRSASQEAAALERLHKPMDESEVKTLVMDYYNTRGEFSGTFVMIGANVLSLSDTGEGKKVAQVEYTYGRSSNRPSGRDQRNFHLLFTDGLWHVVNMTR